MDTEASYFSEATFQENLTIYSTQNQAVAKSLLQVNPACLKPCKSRDGNWNLKQEHNGEDLYLLSPYSPVKEAKKWREGLTLKNTEVLYIYGVGLGYYYDELEAWLEESESHFIVFLEDNLAVLRRFLQTKLATKVLKNKRVQIHTFSDIDSAFDMIEWLAWFFVYTRMDVTALESYERNKETIFFTLRLRLSQEMTRITGLTKEYMQFGKAFYRNDYRNLMTLDQNFHGNQLFGKFRGVPAVICGAGPSLAKNGHLLHDLKDRALIFAGGSSTNSLDRMGIEPNFGGTIDPNPPQRDRMWRHNLFKTPFFYRNRVFHVALNTLQGPRLYVNGTGGYAISDWVESELGIKDVMVDEGHNVINFLTEIAYHMGCNPIIFVGLDLAYTDDKLYGVGVDGIESPDIRKLVETKQNKSPIFPRKDIHGEAVLTEWKWVMESEWIDKYARARPNTRFINSTEGGIGMGNYIPNIPLAEVLQKECKRCEDLEGRVLQSVMQGTFRDVTFTGIDNFLTKVCDGSKTILNKVSRILEILENLEKKQKKKRTAISIDNNTEIASLEKELREEPVYESLYSVMSKIKHKIAHRKLVGLSGVVKTKTERQRALDKIAVNKEMFGFLKEAVHANVETLTGACKEMCARGYKVTRIGKEEQGVENDKNIPV